MGNKENSKLYDLEQRTLVFARNTRNYLKKLPKTLLNMDDVKQVLRSSGSVGANYIEANESLSKKDFLMRVKICRKEAKESVYWFNLIENPNNELRRECLGLMQESKELMMIFGSIIRKLEN